MLGPRGHPASALAGVAVIGGAEQREDHRDLSRSGIRSKRWRYPTDAAKPFATVATLST